MLIFILITSDLSKATLKQKFEQNILFWVDFFSCTVKAYLRVPQKMQGFKQLARNFWQSSYLPFEDSVITSHFIARGKVGAAESIDYYGGGDAAWYIS